MRCHLCGASLAESTSGRKNHMKLYHAVSIPKPKYRPRTEVVAEWEAINARYLILPNERAGIELMPKELCIEGCTCNTCFNSALDRLVASTEEAANDARTRLDINDVVASDQLQVSSTTDGLDTVQHFDGR